MDKNTFSHYGWIVVVVIIICILMSTINPFLSLIKVQLGSTFDALDNATTGALDKIVVGGYDGGGSGGGGGGGGTEKLPTPTLSIEDGSLIITTSSSDVEYYAITVNGSDVGSVSAVMPDTEYDLSGLADETHVIGVIAKAAGKEDSDRATITYTKKSKLASPVVTVEDDKLIIDGPDDTEEYEITIDGVVVGTVPAEHPTTEYELPEFDAGEHTIDVVAKADGKEDSDRATVVCEKLSKPVISAADNTLTIMGPEGAKYYEIFIDGTSVGSITATSPSTKYDLSNLALGDYEISVVAKADGKYDSDPATTTYKQRIAAIGKTDPSYVLAVFNDDFTSVEISKNGAESDGLMKNFSQTNSPMQKYGSTLLTATVDEGVKSIGDSAFRECVNITNIDIPSTLKAIGGASFYNCKALLSLDLPEGLESIGNYAFNDCKSLTTMTVPSTVTSFAQNVFKYCTGLKTVTFNNSMSSLGSEVLSNCWALESVVMPSGVVTIAGGVFNECHNLKSIVIPEGVTSIGGRAFYNCHALESINFPSTLTSIGEMAFDGCYKIPDITIPYGVTTIATNAFARCSSATSVYIPASVTSIGTKAFFGCKGLSSINIPASVNSVETNAFIDCVALKTFNFEAATAPTGFENSGYNTSATLNFNVTM